MKYLVFGLLLMGCPAFGQEFNFDIHNTSLEEFLKMEVGLGSTRMPTTSNHVSFSGEAQPIKYLRKEKVIPDSIAFYFFKKSDSAMSYILYEWDVFNFEKHQINQTNLKSEEFKVALINKYKNLRKIITAQFGKPKIK